MPDTARNLLNMSRNQGSRNTFIGRMTAKRGFNSKIDAMLERFLDRIP